jgi:hypothetical protein
VGCGVNGLVMTDGVSSGGGGEGGWREITGVRWTQGLWYSPGICLEGGLSSLCELPCRKAAESFPVSL